MKNLTIKMRVPKGTPSWLAEFSKVQQVVAPAEVVLRLQQIAYAAIPCGDWRIAHSVMSVAIDLLYRHPSDLSEEYTSDSWYTPSTCICDVVAVFGHIVTELLDDSQVERAKPWILLAVLNLTGEAASNAHDDLLRSLREPVENDQTTSS